MSVLEPIRSFDVAGATGSTRRIERALNAGELVRIRHGAYAPTEAWDAARAEQRMLAAVESTAAAARTREPVFALEAAAAIQGIPVVGPWPSRAVTLVAHPGSKTNGSVIRIRREEPPSSITRVGALLVTTPVVTVIDLAARRPLLAGIVAIAHARRHLGIGLAELHAEIARRRPFPGVRRAEIAVARSTDGSHSPLETLVIVRCQDYGFAPPVQQFAVIGVDGRAYEVDFAWRGGRILGEADGREKYGLGAAERGVGVTDRIWAEKRREDAIRPTCDRFIRFDWADAWRGAPLERALVAAGVPRIRRPRPLTR